MSVLWFCVSKEAGNLKKSTLVEKYKRIEDSYTFADVLPEVEPLLEVGTVEAREEMLSLAPAFTVIEWKFLKSLENKLRGNFITSLLEAGKVSRRSWHFALEEGLADVALRAKSGKEVEAWLEIATPVLEKHGLKDKDTLTGLLGRAVDNLREERNSWRFRSLIAECGVLILKAEGLKKDEFDSLTSKLPAPEIWGAQALDHRECTPEVARRILGNLDSEGYELVEGVVALLRRVDLWFDTGLRGELLHYLAEIAESETGVIEDVARKWQEEEGRKLLWEAYFRGRFLGGGYNDMENVISEVPRRDAFGVAQSFLRDPDQTIRRLGLEIFGILKVQEKPSNGE